MKFKCLRSDFLDATQITQKAVSIRSTLPILTGMLLQLEGKKLKLSATDLEIAIEYELEVDGEVDGSLVIPARILGDVVRNLPESIIILDSTKFTNQINITCEKSNFTIETLPPEDFPKFPEITHFQSIKLKSNLLNSVIRQVSKAASHDETRPVLSGVLINITKDRLKMVATDSYRLAIREVKIDEDVGEEKIRVIIPERALEELSKILPSSEAEVTLGITENQIVFKEEKLTLISRLIEGQYPNYQQLLPENYKLRLEIDKEIFIGAIKRVSLFALNNVPLKLNIKGNLMRISAHTPGVGKAVEEIPVKGGQEEIEMAFNGQFLLDGANSVIGEKIIFEITDVLRPGMIRSAEQEDSLYLVMPVRLS